MWRRATQSTYTKCVALARYTMSWIKWETCKQTQGKTRARSGLCPRPSFSPEPWPHILSCLVSLCLCSAARTNLGLLIPASSSAGTSETVQVGLRAHVQNDPWHHPTPPQPDPRSKPGFNFDFYLLPPKTHTFSAMCVCWLKFPFFFLSSEDFHLHRHIRPFVTSCNVPKYF